MSNMEWLPEELRKGALIDAQLDALKEAYYGYPFRIQQDQHERDIQGQREKLNSVVSGYADVLVSRLRETGVDLEALLAEFEAIKELEDRDTVQQRINQLLSNLTPAVIEAFEYLGIHEDKVEKDMIEAVSPPLGVHVEYRAPFGLVLKPSLDPPNQG